MTFRVAQSCHGEHAILAIQMSYFHHYVSVWNRFYTGEQNSSKSAVKVPHHDQGLFALNLISTTTASQAMGVVAF